jgi:RNA polymerase sigma-70 factor (ECF subfamily)
MEDNESLANHFERHRPRLVAVAYRMLGSLAEAEDAVQETWLRLSRSGTDDVENLSGWLTTVVARICLNMLRSRKLRREEPLDVHIPDPVITPDNGVQPEEEALLADSISLALLVVLHTLSADERLAFVLHDMFDLPFDQIAPIIGRTPQATRQLASRARRRVKGAEIPSADPDLTRQRAAASAFFSAARHGDFDGLLAILHPGVLLRNETGAQHPAAIIRGSAAVAKQATAGIRALLASPTAELHPVLINGNAGALLTIDQQPFSAISFTITDGKIAEIDAIADPERLRKLIRAVLNVPGSGGESGTAREGAS